MVEIGPQAGLTALARRGVSVEDHLWLASLRRRDTTTETTLTALSDYYAAGLNVSWTDYHAGHPAPARVDLPTYAFQRKRYWLPSVTPRRTAAARPARHPLLGIEERFASGVREFNAEFTAEELGALADLADGGRTVLPARRLRRPAARRAGRRPGPCPLRRARAETARPAGAARRDPDRAHHPLAPPARRRRRGRGVHDRRR
ncbi:hypothetical protein ACQ4WX_36240 [Streptomyces lasalocidi]